MINTIGLPDCIRIRIFLVGLGTPFPKHFSQGPFEYALAMYVISSGKIDTRFCAEAISRLKVLAPL